MPEVNVTLNISLSNIQINNVVNVTANITDDTELSFCQVITNQTGFKEFFNFSLSGTEDTCSQNFTIFLSQGGVINFTVQVNDTFGNIIMNDTIITVAIPPDTTAPGINITSPINSTTYIVDFVDLNFTINETPDWCAYSLDGGVNDTSICSSFCYQESANETDQTGIDGSCGLNYSGRYYVNGSFAGGLEHFTYDGNWDTAAN